MRVVSFRRAGRASFGLLNNGAIVEVGRRLGGVYSRLHDLLRRVGAEETLTLLVAYEQAPADAALAEPELDKPLTEWGECFCVGVNYPERNAECRDNSTAPSYPSLFVRIPESFIAHGQALVWPPESPQLDYEGENVMAIGELGPRIAPETWREHVFGWTLGDEGTIRDWVRHGKFNVTPGKNWPGSGAIGPWIVPFAETGAGPFDIVTRVNGQERQRDSTARTMFSFGRIVEYISAFCTLQAGDIIFIGTPAGAGARMNPPVYLAPGDIVEVECAQIRRLRNSVREE
ncbi:MAG TPA: fumarylacetoacetate hydrolase family protein [Roseiarcus sp.]|nr:fumarylacetoacetate hydrolase family protein [Roseiarcus sp.]